MCSILIRTEAYWSFGVLGERKYIMFLDLERSFHASLCSLQSEWIPLRTSLLQVCDRLRGKGARVPTALLDLSSGLQWIALIQQTQQRDWHTAFSLVLIKWKRAFLFLFFCWLQTAYVCIRMYENIEDRHDYKTVRMLSKHVIWESCYLNFRGLVLGCIEAKFCK